MNSSILEQDSFQLAVYQSSAKESIEEKITIEPEAIETSPPEIREKIEEDQDYDVTFSNKLETAKPFTCAKRVNGIIVVSPCPPTTTPCKSLEEQFNCCDK